MKESGDYVAVFEETPGIIIGAPEDKNYDLPSYSTDYSSSQQIYTSEEIGWSGTITGLSFFNTYEQTIRDYDIYMVHIDKTSFSSNTDWIAVTESDIVFSGEVTMTAGCWKTIVLDTPFAYNGTSNLAIVINDKTGNSFVYGSTSSMSGRVFNTQAHQAIRYRGLSSFNPYNPFGYSGSRLSVKNQIVLQMTPAFVISASANPTEAGIISGTGSYVEGNTCTLIATPNTGYTFKNWMKNGEVVSTNASYSFTVTGDVTFVANFNTPSYVISATVSPSVGGTVSGEGTFVVGSTCTLTAIPNPGYSFMYWYDTYNMRIVSYDAEYSFTVNGNRELRAYFSLPSTITASPDSSGGGSVTGGGVFDYGVTCTLTATANPGYTFIKWTKNGSTVSYLSPFNFSVTESGDYVAVFEETPGIVVGAPESTNDHLPTYPVGYNLTQQIYTHDEIRGSGAITDISFFNTGTQRAGNYNIYLVHTDKTAFNGNADWIAVTESDRVFSGEVAMMTGCWTTITLDTPFAYNGSSNLAIVVYSYLQGSIYQCSFSCRTFNTPGNQAIYYSGNSVDVLNPYNPSGYNGTLLSVKNQIVFQGIDCQTQTQTVSLSAGWNWVSFYIEADPIELLQMLEEGLGENGIVIKGGDITTEYDEEWGWFGDLDDEGIVNEQMYLVRTVAACTVVMEGTPANPANHAITINPGWNWIGFPCPVSVGIEDAFSGFNAAPCDILKWGDFSTEYDEEWGWFGDIETLVPGQGFLYYSNASTSKTLVFQTGSGK